MELPLSNYRVNFPDKKYCNFVFIVFEIVILGLAAYFQKPLYILVFLGFLFLSFWSLFSIKRTLFIFLTYLVLFPNQPSFEKYPYLLAPVSLQLLAVFLLILTFYLITDKMSSDTPSYMSLSGLDKLFIIFFTWVIVAALFGLKNGGKQAYIILELYFFGFYLMYFIISRSVESLNSIKHLIAALIIISVIVSCEYIYIAIRESGISGGLLLKRVSTQQPHIAQITIPFLMSYYFFKKQKKVVLLVSILLIPLFLMVFFSQQRALWVGILISLIILWFLSFVEQGVTIHNLMKFILYLIAAISFVVIILVVVDKMLMGSSLLTLITRANTLLDLSNDASLSIRLAEINHALAQWRENIFLGTGLGSWISPVILSHIPENHIDNSYVFILWKTGIAGLFIFISIWAVFFKKAFYLFNKSLNSDVRQIAGAIIAAFSGLLIVALTNTCIIYYRFNILWALLIGLVEVMYRREIKMQEPSHD